MPLLLVAMPLLLLCDATNGAPEIHELRKDIVDPVQVKAILVCAND